MENKEQLDDVEEAKALLDAHLGDTLEHELSAADLTEHLKTLKRRCRAQNTHIFSCAHQ